MDWRAILGIVLAWTLGVIVTLVKFGSSVSTRQAVSEEKVKNLESELKEQKENLGMTRDDLEASIRKVLENGGVRTELKTTNDTLIRLEGKVEVFMGTQNQINIRLEEKVNKESESCLTNSKNISELVGNVAHISGLLEGNHKG